MEATIEVTTFGRLRPGDAFIVVGQLTGVAVADSHLPFKWIPQVKVKVDDNIYCTLGDLGHSGETCLNPDLPVLPVRVYQSLKAANASPVPRPRRSFLRR